MQRASRVLEQLTAVSLLPAQHWASGGAGGKGGKGKDWSPLLIGSQPSSMPGEAPDLRSPKEL